MDIKQYLDSTYLKTAIEANISESSNEEVIKTLITEAITYNFKLVMLRPEYVSLAKSMITDYDASTLIGTVIDFPLGQNSLHEKLMQAKFAIDAGVDDLDFVVNYEAFKAGDISLVKNEILQCTTLGLQHKKTVKWIIEAAALNDKQIVQITVLIKNCVMTNFKEDQFESVFVKSSTGYFATTDGSPSGATYERIMLMIENASPLPVKASGGIRTAEQALGYIRMGVKRIGTSMAKEIVETIK